jgi:hypothetical protein
MVAESSASRSLRPASKANPLAEFAPSAGPVRMHEWRGQVHEASLGNETRLKT